MQTQIERNAEDPVEILLVEDNPGDVRLVEVAFESANRETTLPTVRNGDDAIDWLIQRATEDTYSLPDLVLLDLNLPGRGGCDVLRAIRADPRLEFLPVIIMSSSSAREDLKRCYNADANAYMTKPTDPDEFESLVAKIEQFWFEHAVLPSGSA